MTDKKYYKYSREELAFVEVYKNRFHKYIKNFPLFLIGFILCFLILGLLSFVVESPGERKLRNEKIILQCKFDDLSKKVSEFENQVLYLNAKDDSLYRTILGIEPLPKTMKEAGFGGNSLGSDLLNPVENGTPNSIASRIDKLKSKFLVLDSSMNQVFKAAYLNKERMSHIPAIMPIYNKDLKGTGAGFGLRIHPILGIKRMHEGLDFYARTGTEVFATADGVIEKVYFSNTFGNVIIINHSFGIESYYAHLSKFKVKKGQKVKRGDVIGYVGSTGLSSGPHLHYEVHLRGKEVDPVNYFYADLNPEQYKKIVEIAKRETVSMD